MKLRLPFSLSGLLRLLPSMSPITRITLGLVSLGLSLILGFDMVFGLFPRETETARQIRQRVSQNIAIQSTALLDNRDLKTLERTARGVLAKDPDLLSIGFRRTDGNLVVSAGDHQLYWKGSSNEGSTLENVLVPLNAEGRKWGALELSFRPPGAKSVGEWLLSPAMRLFFAFLVGASFIYYFYLRRVLQKMDPSSSVPDRVKMAFDTLSEGIVILDGNARAIMVNKSVRDMTGLENEQFIGKEADQFHWLKPQDEEAGMPWRNALRKREPVLGRTFSVTGAKGGLRKVVVNCAPILDMKKAPRGCMVTINDVSALEEAKEHLMDVLGDLATSKHQLESQNGELERLASRDPLTGAFNRRAFFERYERAYSTANRSKGKISCIMADIDKFKRINDTYGHGVGDQVIQEFARILQSEARASDLVGRYGGEEFCLVLPGMGNEATLKIAEKIRARVQQYCGLATSVPDLVITASFGIADLSSRATTPSMLVHFADQALYLAKQTGRNRVITYTHGTEAVV